MKRTLLFASAFVLAAGAFAQTNVFRCFNDYTTSYGPTGATGVFQGQPDITQWVALPERGSQLVLASAGNLSEISFNYLCLADIPPVGGESVTVRIYALDAANGTSPGNRSGNPYTRPATNPLFSATVPVRTGDRTVRIPVPNVAVPQDVVVTYQFSGGNFNTEPYDPALNLYKAGGRFTGKTTAGSLPTTPYGPTQNGLVWRRVYTAAGASTWGVAEVPSTFGVTGWGFGFSLYTGNTGTLTTPWNNETQATNLWAYVDAIGFPHGQLATCEGTNTKLTNGHLGLYVDTTSNPAGGSVVLGIYPPREAGVWGDLDGPGTPDLSNPLFVSAPVAIPGNYGTAGSGTRLDLDIAIPGVVVPQEFIWTVEFSGMLGGIGDNAGPGLIFAPDPGTTANGVYIFNNSGTSQWEGPFVYEANVGGLYTHASQIDGVFTGTSVSTTETLAPTSEQILLGTNGSGGNLASWASNDGNNRTICKFFVPTATSPFIRANLNYTTTKTNITALSFDVKVAVDAGGTQQITLNLQNKTTNAFVATSVVGQNTAANTTYSGVAAGTLNDYKNGSGAMTGQIEVKAVGFQTSAFPCIGFDSANMKVTG